MSQARFELAHTKAPGFKPSVSTVSPLAHGIRIYVDEYCDKGKLFSWGPPPRRAIFVHPDRIVEFELRVNQSDIAKFLYDELEWE